MPVRKTRFRCALVLWSVLQAHGAVAGWVVNERGDCVAEWTAGSLLRGPTALLNSPLVPFRSAAGGVQLALNDPAQGGAKRKVLLVPTLATIGGAMGLVEAAIWLGTGLADTLTGGYFALAPVPATELSVAPIRPLFSPDGRRPTTDPCGRPPSDLTARSS
jgi:hypothetical protein